MDDKEEKVASVFCTHPILIFVAPAQPAPPFVIGYNSPPPFPNSPLSDFAAYHFFGPQSQLFKIALQKKIFKFPIH